MCTALIELYWFNGHKRSSYLLLYQRQLMFLNDSCVYQRQLHQPVYQWQLHQPVFINDSYISLCLPTTATSACLYQWQLYQPVYQRQLHQPVYQRQLHQPVYQWQLYQPVFINDSYISLFINDSYISLCLSTTATSVCLCLSMTAISACVYQRQLHQSVFVYQWQLHQPVVLATDVLVLIIIMYDFWDIYVLCDECMLWQRHLFCFVGLCCEKWWWCVSCLFSKMSLFWLVLTDIWSYDRNVLCDRCTHAVAVASLTVADVIPTALTPQRHHTTMRNLSNPLIIA